MFRSANPVFRNLNRTKFNDATYEKASYLGVGLKTLYYLLITVGGAFLGLYLCTNYPETYIISLMLSMTLGFICAIVAMRSVKLALPFGTAYCLFEGMFLGVVSILFESIIPGIIVSTLAATLSIVLVCATLFITGLVKVNNKFYKFLLLFAGGFILSMLVLWIFELCGFISMTGGLYVLVSLISIALASLYLLSDIDQAYQLVNSNGPKEMEWMVAFGLSYTILWLYVELLRFLSIFMNRRN